MQITLRTIKVWTASRIYVRILMASFAQNLFSCRNIKQSSQNEWSPNIASFRRKKNSQNSARHLRLNFSTGMQIEQNLQDFEGDNFKFLNYCCLSLLQITTEKPCISMQAAEETNIVQISVYTCSYVSQGFIQEKSWGGGKLDMVDWHAQNALPGGSGGMLPQENFEKIELCGTVPGSF